MISSSNTPFDGLAAAPNRAPFFRADVKFGTRLFEGFFEGLVPRISAMIRVAREPLEGVAALHPVDLEVYKRVLHGRRRGRRRVRREPSGMLCSPKAYRNGQETLDHRHPHILRPFVQRRGLPAVQRTKAGVAPLRRFADVPPCCAYLL